MEVGARLEIGEPWTAEAAKAGEVEHPSRGIRRELGYEAHDLIRRPWRDARRGNDGEGPVLPIRRMEGLQIGLRPQWYETIAPSLRRRLHLHGVRGVPPAHDHVRTIGDLPAGLRTHPPASLFERAAQLGGGFLPTCGSVPSGNDLVFRHGGPHSYRGQGA